MRTEVTFFFIIQDHEEGIWIAQQSSTKTHIFYAMFSEADKRIRWNFYHAVWSLIIQNLNNCTFDIYYNQMITKERACIPGAKKKKIIKQIKLPTQQFISIKLIL